MTSILHISEFNEKLRRLQEKHRSCTPPKIVKLREKEEFEKEAGVAETQICERFERHVERIKTDDKYFAYARINSKTKPHLRKDYVRGVEVGVSKKYGAYDPLRICRARVDALKHIHDIGKEIYKREIRRLPPNFHFLNFVYVSLHQNTVFFEYSCFSRFDISSTTSDSTGPSRVPCITPFRWLPIKADSFWPTSPVVDSTSRLVSVIHMTHVNSVSSLIRFMNNVLDSVHNSCQFFDYSESDSRTAALWKNRSCGSV